MSDEMKIGRTRFDAYPPEARQDRDTIRGNEVALREADTRRLRDRLAKLEDGIRALADVCDFYDTDDVQIHPQWVTKRLRAILGEDGE